MASPKRLAFALRALAIVELVMISRLAFLWLARDGLADAVQKGQSREELLPVLRLLGRIALVGDAGETLLFIGALGGVALALTDRSARIWAFAAAGSMCVHLVLFGIENVTRAPAEPSLAFKALLWTLDSSPRIGVVMAFVGVARELRVRAAAVLAGISAALAFVDALTLVYDLGQTVVTRSNVWFDRAVTTSNALGFAISAFWMASMVLARRSRPRE
jgi:hypothetical protein